MEIPSEVKNSTGAFGTTYSHIATSKTGMSVTPTEGITDYYAVYTKTVTATKYTYNNQSSTANATIHVSANSSASLLNNATYYASYTYSIQTSYNVNGGSSTAPTVQSSTGYMNYAGTTVGSSITLPAAATSATYSTTSSTTQNGRYYYCVVTSTVDSSTARTTSTTARLTVQAANYSTVKSNVTTYYNTLSSAVSGATSGSPTIRSVGYAINYASGAGNLNLYGGYIYGEKRGAIMAKATGTVLIENTYVYCPVKNKKALYVETSRATTINGSSRVGNGKDNVAGTARVMAGPYAGVGVQRRTAGTLSCTDSACIYALNGNCIYFNVAGCTATFNSSGYFYAAASGSATSSRNFSYMNAYNTTATQSIASCYYYTKGV